MLAASRLVFSEDIRYWSFWKGRAGLKRGFQRFFKFDGATTQVNADFFFLQHELDFRVNEVDDLVAFPAGIDQPGGSQNGKVMGYLRLRQFQ